MRGSDDSHDLMSMTKRAMLMARTVASDFALFISMLASMLNDYYIYCRNLEIVEADQGYRRVYRLESFPLDPFSFSSVPGTTSSCYLFCESPHQPHVPPPFMMPQGPLKPWPLCHFSNVFSAKVVTMTPFNTTAPNAGPHLAFPPTRF